MRSEILRKSGVNPQDGLDAVVPAAVQALVRQYGQRAMPMIAKDEAIMHQLSEAVRRLGSEHRIVLGDARRLDWIADESVHLVVTSPPYWTLKTYLPHESQLGSVGDYEDFLGQLDEVWGQVLRVLVPGGRLVVVVGDVCLSRRQHGRHVVYPLHASIQEHCRRLGFDNLAPIIWHKIANAKLEAEGNGAGFLGKPYEPNGVIKNDIEYILFQRKPGGYRSPSEDIRLVSLISETEHRILFQQIWSLTGASTRNHPAPFPLALAERLIRMFSFVGDTVLDPFLGTGTTALAAANLGRNSYGVEVESQYLQLATRRLKSSFEGNAELFKAEAAR